MSKSSALPLKANRVIIIGAGWYGIAAAKTYLEVNRAVSLTIIDADETIGGTWSKSRIYEGLVANSPSGHFEYSDFSMEANDGPEKWQPINGMDVHKYLAAFAHKHQILERCRLKTEVVSVKKDSSGWNVIVRPTGQESADTEVLNCDKLIISTGLTSMPVTPDIDTKSYTGKIFHSKDLGTAHEYLTSDAVQEVTVLGGGKSAMEACKLCVLAGKKVSWVIREDGDGPAFMLPAYRNGNHAFQVALKRWTEVTKISAYAHRGFWHWLLFSGRNWIGSQICAWWYRKQLEVLRGTRLEETENMRRLKCTAPSMFWVSAISFIHESDKIFMNLLNDGKLITVIRASINSISKSGVHLSNNITIPSNVIIFATGWKASANSIFELEDRLDLGLVSPVLQASQEYLSHWNALDCTADTTVLSTFPILRCPPKALRRSTEEVPYRLFRQIVPPTLAARHNRSIVFLGLTSNTGVAIHAEVSALWGVAYLEGLLPDGSCEGAMGDKEAMDKEVAWTNAFMARRYPMSKVSPRATFEVRSVIDRLMADLELEAMRKKGYRRENEGGIKGWFRGWMRELFEPYLSNDYQGIVREFLGKTLLQEKKRV